MSIVDVYCTDSVTITPKGALGADGLHAAGTAVSTKGRVVDNVGLLKRPGGREIQYKRVVFLKPTESVAVGDTVTAAGHASEVLEVVKRDDLNGVNQLIMLYLT